MSNEKEQHLVYNGLKTPDGTIIVSRSQHDFVMHDDKVTGKSYGVDGGLSYGRLIGDIQDCERIVHFNTEPHETVREFMAWGTYGKNDDQPLRYVAVKDMSDAHIEAIIQQKQGAEWVREILIDEIKFRKKNKISIVD